MTLATRVTPEDVIAGLGALGIQPGDLIFTHISMSKFGHLVGGVEALIAALQAAVGPQGTLVMPGYALQLVNVPRPVFDVRNTPVWASKVYERFRQMPGVVRSHHVTHSVGAAGRLAREVTVDHGPDPCGPRSPFPRLARLGGKILLMGVSHNSNTTFHAIEEQEKLFYCDLREAPGATIIDEEGRPRPLPTRLHNMSRTYDFNRADEPLRAAGIQREMLIGDAVVRCLEARAMFDLVVEMARADPSALLMQADARREIPVCRGDAKGQD